MLPRMKRRSALARTLVLLCAALQLASPGFSAIAHGKLAGQSASGPATHVEATGSAGCPVVHSPDCAVCRYMSTATPGGTGPELFFSYATATVPPGTVAWIARAVPHALPPGRAPPTA